MSHYDRQREVDHEIYKDLVGRGVGGTHYKSAIQPVDYIEANNLDFFEGNVVKYVTRWRRKNGVEDLRKAQHYIEMLIHQESARDMVSPATR